MILNKCPHQLGSCSSCGQCPSCTAYAKLLEQAIKAADMEYKPDLLGNPTLWCTECKRDSGYHWDYCVKR